MRPRKLLHRIRAGNHDNVRFNDLQALMTACGYELGRVSGSHHIYVHRTLPSRLSLQEVRGQAKSYQVRQLLYELDRYDLTVEEDR